MTRSGEGDSLDVADAIALIRGQLVEAQRRMADEGHDGVLFSVGEVTLEIGLELTRAKSVGGGLRFSVVSADGRADRARRATHTVTVTLNPQGPDGAPLPVSDFEPE
ncbi:trypco2 family protein [Streptomyces sp. NPDC048290]|uniref:trypco2 family protein n=1 Tax=Streptomyces sp. NPDC048290 TaxID=3155811 RepID=UPI0034209504